MSVARATARILERPSERTLEDVLRDVKDGLLCYCVSLEYGQMEPGLDDTGASDKKRKIAIEAWPAGFLAAVRVRYQGTRAELLAMDLCTLEPWSNPPTKEERFESPYVLRSGAFWWGHGYEQADIDAKFEKRRAGLPVRKGKP